MDLSAPRLFVKQVFEFAELFGFESRNKYRIQDEAGREIGFAAEQRRGLWQALGRQIFGHWRVFDIHFFTPDRQTWAIAHHPFRWFFQRLEVVSVDGRPLGSIERRWAIFSKAFDVHGPQGQTLFRVRSPFWRIWTFPFHARGAEQARVAKKWSGLASELFTDRDNFRVEFINPALTPDERMVVLAAAVYIDLMFFEKKGDGGAVALVD